MVTRKTLKLLSAVLALVMLMTSFAYAAPVHKDIFKEVSGDNIYNHIAVLAGTDDARLTGSEGEAAAAEYIAGQMAGYGLKIERQQFPVVYFKDNGAELKITSPEVKNLEVQNFSYTPSTSGDGLTAQLVDAGFGSAEEFAGVDVRGKIALIKRGYYTFYDKTQNAAAAGAIGVIIFNREPGFIGGTLGDVTDIPAAEVKGEVGEELRAMLASGQSITVNMKVSTVIRDSFSQNIIGVLKAERGSKDAQTIVIGAHYDSVDTPGANDNASGTAALLEVARVLSTQKLAYNLKFIAFGAEEAGLIGAYNYVEGLSQEQLDNTAAMINMDMVGVGDKVGIMTLAEDSDSFIADLAEVYLNKFNLAYDRSASDASDHAPFEEYGVPVVFFDYHDDPYYHTDADSTDKISKTNLYNIGTLVTAMTYDIAKTPMPKSKKGLKAKVNKYKFKNPEIAAE